MEKTNINGLMGYNFGENNYSEGLEACTFDPTEYTPEQIQSTKGLFLHPSLIPNSCEIYALRGNETQYKLFTEKVREQDAIKAAMQKYDFMDKTQFPKYSALKDKIYAEWKPWFER